MRFGFLLYFLVPSIAFAQHPLRWQLHAKKLDTATYQLQIKAFLEKGWYAYDKDINEAIQAPSIQWDNENITALGAPLFTTKPLTIHDAVYAKQLKIFRDSFSFSRQIKTKGHIPRLLSTILTAYIANGTEFLAVTDTVPAQLQGGVEKNAASDIILTKIDLKNPVANCGDQQQGDQRLLSSFFLGLLGGLIALFTPCVFPMIPITVSFFTGKSKNKKDAIKNGLGYGISIFLIYLLASIPFHLLENIDPQIFNSISTNAGVNIFFFIVFIVFAFSFFGWFEITLPASFSNLAGSKSNLGNAAGIFFMALTLAIVSFSCTGPILGSLLVGSLSSNGAAHLTAGMSGFGLALGLPFAVFAMFPQWVQRIPRSGKWMNVVKKSLAFVELALAIKFLSNADLVEHWGIMKREIFIALWIVISILLSLYLFGVFEKRKAQPPSFMRVVRTQPKLTYKQPRFFFAVLVLLFACYLLPGITRSQNANLKLLSGFPPPLSYSIYGKANLNDKGLEPNVVNDYQKAIELARMQNKPLLLDFTGWACVNCRKMEENVWLDPVVKELIKKKFILVSLYVDDRKKLPVDERFIFKMDGEQKDIVTIGDKYATFQVKNFKQATQPMYVIISPGEKLLNHPVGYTPSVAQYQQWLECGYNAFEKTRSN